LLGQLDPLGLAAGQGGGLLADVDVAQAWVSGMSVALAYGPWASACRQLMASDESGGGGDALVAAPAGHGAAEAAHAEPAHDAHGHEAAAHDAHSHDSHGHEAHGHADHGHGGG